MSISVVIAPLYVLGAGLGAVLGLLRSQWQSAERDLLQIEQAIRRGEAAQLAIYFQDPVEIVIERKARMHARAQAQYVLRDFFQQNPPKSFTFLHKGRSENVSYAIGAYITANSRWDVSVFGRMERGRYQIEQLRFEPVE